ncbi:DciA family protein [Streptomyces sp. NPDC008092]|uniref:DUF721 domain-containing protein n=1 Tax=Streptomyces sp. NPDC008092 TaxID=3364808 RepID=UPI0036E1FD27
MTDAPQMPGRDLARQALAAYKATARTTPAAAPARTRRKRVTRPGDGRDPISLATAITGLGADLPLDAGLAGGNLIDQWPTLCPQYVGLVEPARYDEQTGRLDLRPASHTYAAQLRLLGGQLAKQINDKLGRPVVRTIRVLPVGAVTAAQPAPAAPAEDDPKAPVKTRQPAPPGYRIALEAVLAHRPERPPADPYQAAAIARQEAALRANRQPEAEHRDAVWAQADAETKAGPAAGSMAASERAALAFKRRDQAGLNQPRRAFDTA